MAHLHLFLLENYGTDHTEEQKKIKIKRLCTEKFELLTNDTRTYLLNPMNIHLFSMKTLREKGVQNIIDKLQKVVTLKSLNPNGHAQLHVTANVGTSGYYTKEQATVTVQHFEMVYAFYREMYDTIKDTPNVQIREIQLFR